MDCDKENDTVNDKKKKGISIFASRTGGISLRPSTG